jgi:Mg/Co/Ni transporter MgtE
VTRYGLITVPVVDERRRLMGVITASDALWDVLPEEWRREAPRRLREGSIAAAAAKRRAKSAPRVKSTASKSAE